MEAEVKEQLEKVRIDVEGTLDRMMGNEALFMRILNKFLEDRSFSRLKEFQAAGDYVQAFAHAHTLKGLSANLGMKGVCEEAAELVETLRPLKDNQTNAATEELIRDKVEKLEIEYTHVVQAIQKIL